MVNELNHLRILSGLEPLREDDTSEDNLPAFLFHGTNVYHLLNILRTNSLDEGVHWGKPDEPHGPRLTKSAKVAYSFGQYSSPDLGEETPTAILVLHTERLRQSYELVEYTDRTYGGDSFGQDEQEVVPITNRISPLTDYLKTVLVSRVDMKMAVDPEFLQFAIEYPLIDKNIAGTINGPDDLKSMLERMFKSPSVQSY